MQGETNGMENKFEMAPKGPVVIPEGQDFAEAFKDFNDQDDETGEYNQGIVDAAALINYGLDAACRELGVEAVVQKIKGFVASGSENPIKDFFEYMGVDTPEEYKNVQEKDLAAKPSENEFRGDVNAPTQRKSTEGAFKAIEDMKELIAEVEGADPRYEELRQGAKAAGKGYFEYAVSSYNVRGLTELFMALSEQREKAEEKMEQNDNVDEKVVDLNDKVGVDEVIESGVEGRVDENRGEDGTDRTAVDLDERIRNKERLNPEILEQNASQE